MLKGQKIYDSHTIDRFIKKEIIEKGRALGIDYGLTRTCYDPTPDGIPCGACDACLLRLKGFQEAGLEDPLDYPRG